MAKKIPLTKGYEAIVDDDDFDRVSRFKWTALESKGRVYAYRNVGNGKQQRLHRLILNAPACSLVDHVNGNGLDNRKSNLRLCSASENIRNSQAHTDGSSKYKGVSWYTARQNWHARIYVGGETLHLGYFLSEQDAAQAYDHAAKKHFGQFARLNFPRRESK